MLPPHPLHSLFAARHIAVIGASQRSETLGGRVFASMLNHPFQGRLTPVNLRHPTVAGLQAYAQISQIDDKPDAAVAVCHASAHPSIAAACLRLRIPLRTTAITTGNHWHACRRLPLRAGRRLPCAVPTASTCLRKIFMSTHIHTLPRRGKLPLLVSRRAFAAM